MAVAFDALGAGGSSGQVNDHAGGALASWSHTISGSNTLLIVAVAVTDTQSGTDDTNKVTTVTCDGTNMSPFAIRHSGDSNSGYGQLFYLLGVSTGAKTIAVSVTNTPTCISAGSISFTGVDQTYPMGIPISTSTPIGGSAVSISQVIPSATDDMVFGYGVNAKSAVPTAGNTSRWASNNGSQGSAHAQVGETAAGASSVTMSASTTGADWWAFIAVNIRAVNTLTVPTPVGTTISTYTASATSLPVNYPPGILAGDLLTLFVGTKPYNASIGTPANWSAAGSKTNGTTAQGADTGSTLLAAFTKTADGTETGTLTVTVTSGNSSWGSMIRTAAPASTSWDLANTGGTATAATSWTTTFDADPGISANDVILLAAATSTDVTVTNSAMAITATGATFQTMSGHGLWDIYISTGNDSGGSVAYAIATGGPSSAAPVWTMTKSVSTNQAASTLLVRARAAAVATSNPPPIGTKSVAVSRAANW